MPSPFAENLREILDLIEQYVAKLPEPLQSKGIQKLKLFRALTVDARSPRLALVARSGAGKSSLINAIFKEKVAEVGEVASETGQGRWYKCSGKFGELEFLDTRGLFEGNRPVTATEETPFEEIIKACRDEYPDAILFLCKAKELRAHIHEDIEQVIKIQKRLEAVHGYRPPVIGVVTQVDELDPLDDVNPPFEDPDKLRIIAQAQKMMHSHLEAHGIETEVFTVCTYSRFNAAGELVGKRHYRLEELLTFLSSQLPDNALVALARATRISTVQKRLADMVISATSGAAGVVGSNPIPVADLPVITSLQIGMVIMIGYISGRKMDKEAAVEFLSAIGINVGVAFLLREAARGLIKVLFPGGGLVVSGLVAASATYGLGQAAMAYFIDGVPVGQAKDLIEKARVQEEARRKALAEVAATDQL